MTALGQTYFLEPAGTNWRELQILDDILNLDPRATPFFEVTGVTDAPSKEHFWQVRGVKARAVNKALEGATLVGQEVSPPTRVNNNTQIQHTGVEITRTTMSEQHYGVSDIWQDQLALYEYEHRADTEYVLIRGMQDTGTTTTAREMQGLLAATTTNVSDLGGISGAFNEFFFVDAIETSWKNIDTPALDCMVCASARKRIDIFDSRGATRRMDVMIREIPNVVTKYISSFGDVNIFNSRDLIDTSTSGEVIFFDRTDKKKAYLDRTFLQPVAKTQDADTAVIIDELTLEYGNEASGVKVTGINTTNP